MSPLPTKTSTRRPSDPRHLSEVARHVVVPSGIVSTGWPPVYRRIREFGDEFDVWQQDCGKLILAKRASGEYAATVGGITISIARQVAKTFMTGRIIFALCSIFSNLTVIWTAHRTRTSDETFKKLCTLAKNPKVAPHIDGKPRESNGQQEIRFRNGSRILFGAREAGFGRGFDEVDILVFDEAQILSDKAPEDMVAATNQSRFEAGALIFYMGTPPRPIDPGEVFAQRRRDALAFRAGAEFGAPSVGDDAVYIECSADRDADPDDRKQWEKGNPSFPLHTPLRAMMRLRKNLPSVASWRREGMGIWDDDQVGVTRVVPATIWASARITTVPQAEFRCFGMVFDFETDNGALAGAVKHDDGVHLELIDVGAVNIEALADWLEARWRDVGMIAIAGGAGSKALKQALLDRKVPERVIRLLTTPEYYAGNAMLTDGLTAGTVTVPAGASTDALEQSVQVSDRKNLLTGWRWIATSPDGDQLPMEALSVALWAARTNKRRPGRKAVAT